MILALIASACGGVVERFGPELVIPALAAGWTPAITLTPTAWTWFEAANALDPLRRMTSLPVRSASRLPSEPKPYPLPDAFLVCPASLNTVAKLALGISDSQALTAAVEGVGSGRPFVLVPSLGDAQRRHPAYRDHEAALRRAGVRIREPGTWTGLLDEL